jgi:hypothetical protein
MFYHTSVISFVAYFVVVWQPVTPVELIPVEAGVEDSGALSSSFRSAPLDLRQDQSFERLYKVAGQDGVYVRKSGGLYAVFKNSKYIDTKFGSFPVVPAGTVYSIGEIPSLMLGQLSTLADTEDPETLVNNAVQNSPAVPHNSPTMPSRFTPVQHDGVRFLKDEPYRRHKLALLVLKIILKEK